RVRRDFRFDIGEWFVSRLRGERAQHAVDDGLVLGSRRPVVGALGSCRQRAQHAVCDPLVLRSRRLVVGTLRSRVVAEVEVGGEPAPPPADGGDRAALEGQILLCFGLWHALSRGGGPPFPRNKAGGGRILRLY